MKIDRSKEFNLNTIIISVGTAIILASIMWVGRTAATTHDSVIRLEVKQLSSESSINEIKERMITREALSIELLKLQVTPTKIVK